jgi:hypothetical protein
MFVLVFLVVMVAVFVVMSVLIVLVMVMLLLARIMLVLVRMRVSVSCAITMRVLVAVLMREVNVEFDSFDGGFVSAGNVQMIAVELQLFQFVFEVVRIDTEIEQRADEHVAADPAEDVQIQRFSVCDGIGLGFAL